MSLFLHLTMSGDLASFVIIRFITELRQDDVVKRPVVMRASDRVQ